MLGVAAAGASRTGVVVSLLPCVTFVIGLAVFGERAGVRTAAGTGLAVVAAVGYGLGSGAAGGPLPVSRLLTGLGLALAGTVAYAFYGFVYRQTMPDLPPLAALPAITGVSVVLLAPGALLSLAAAHPTWSDLLGLVLLGGGLTAPVFLLSHELILRRGPLFTSAVALLVPFLVRLGEWAVGQARPPGPVPVLLLAACAAGVWLTVTGRAAAGPVAPREPVAGAARPGGTG
jgi:drug/metabolite transporter (DMT)-like permease